MPDQPINPRPVDPRTHVLQKLGRPLEIAQPNIITHAIFPAEHEAREADPPQRTPLALTERVLEEAERVCRRHGEHKRSVAPYAGEYEGRDAAIDEEERRGEVLNPPFGADCACRDIRG